MNTPKRIQRQRTKGWRMPEGTVYVGRPGVWGNPYDVKRYGLDLCIALFAETARGCWNPSLVPDCTMRDQWLTWLYDAHCAWLRRIAGVGGIDMARVVLRGKDLCCWCPLDQPCHADILLAISNDC